ncbi:MAG: VOC family protein [Planctomycetes bacterium]|nr:VOC family protein [Planctomycetota bacterium]MCB9872199.1 VOC family protein [Planctomycetota bacterium]
MPQPAPYSVQIIPSLTYRDAPAAIEWLGAAFGFSPHLVVPGEGGTIEHAQLTFGRGMIMLGSAKDNPFGAIQRPPASPDATVTQSLYVLVDDVDRHCARAAAAGAHIVMQPEDQPYGGRLYLCRDVEGHLWCFGSYDPFAEAAG